MRYPSSPVIREEGSLLPQQSFGLPSAARRRASVNRRPRGKSRLQCSIRVSPRRSGGVAQAVHRLELKAARGTRASGSCALLMETTIGLPDPARATSSTPLPPQSWFALSVAPRHEKAVTRLLGDKGFETLLPLYQRRHQYVGRERSFGLPLFPGYTFCRFDPAVRLPILTTPGVVQVIGAGKTPVPVGDGEIESIRRAMEAGVAMTPVPYWTEGSRGRIANGPLAGVEGIVMDARRPVRLVLSIGLLQRSVLLEIDAGSVEPV